MQPVWALAFGFGFYKYCDCEEATNRVAWLYVYLLKQLVLDTLTPPAEIVEDIAVWFTVEACKKAEHMYFENRPVITAESCHQQDPVVKLEGTSKFVHHILETVTDHLARRPVNTMVTISDSCCQVALHDMISGKKAGDNMLSQIHRNGS